MATVTIYMSYVILLPILHYVLPKSILYWENCYIYSMCIGYSTTVPISHLSMNWYVRVFYTIELLILLHLGYFLYISPVHGLFYHLIIVTYAFVFICLWMFYPFFLQYVCVTYTIYSLFVLHLGRIVIHIYCKLLVMPLPPFLLTCIHNRGVTPLCFN